MNLATPRTLLLAALSLSLAVGAFAKPKTAKSLDTDLQKFSYAIGMDIGNYLKDQVGEMDMEMFQQGLDQARLGQELLLTEEQAMEIKMAEGPKRQEANAKAKEAESTAFLESNAKKPGVTTTASGLQYEVLTPSDGPKPLPFNKVPV